MITLTHEEAQKMLDALNTVYGAPRYEASKILRAKMHEYPINKVRPHEFLKAVEGKENLIGMPIMWAEWPTKEEL